MVEGYLNFAGWVMAGAALLFLLPVLLRAFASALPTMLLGTMAIVGVWWLWQ